MEKRTRVLLVSPQEDLDVIGLKYLHYSLIQGGYDSRLMFLPRFNDRDRQSAGAMADFAAGLAPDLIGVSLMSHEFERAAAITAQLKERLPGVPTVWGGIHPTIDPEGCLEHADYACVGEGETALMKMAAAVDAGRSLNAVENLCYLVDGAVTRNELVPLIEDLDSLPAPEHVPASSYIQVGGEILPLDAKTARKHSRYGGRTYSVISSRGCPFSCTYCCNNYLSRLYGKKRVRRRSVGSVLEELERAVKENPQLEYINFQDDCFIACGQEYMEEFCRGYRKRVRLPFIIRSIPTYVKKERLAMLKDAGLGWISLGLQSGSDRVCTDIYKRKSLKEDFLKAARVVNELKIAAFYDVILDNPFETDEERLETVETLMQTPKPFYPQIFSLSLYHGTELHERALEEHPDQLEDPRAKNYLRYRRTPVNNMMRMAVFINPALMRRLMTFYLHHPHSTVTHALLSTVGLFSSAVLEPVTYFRLIRLSKDGSTAQTVKVLPSYFRKGLERYLDQFRKQDRLES